MVVGLGMMENRYAVCSLLGRWRETGAIISRIQAIRT
jgi:hypothetical protein